jgi:hypothetical protein
VTRPSSSEPLFRLRVEGAVGVHIIGLESAELSAEPAIPIVWADENDA